MKGIKKIVLVSAITAISTGAFAELKYLDDSTLSQVTGKAGLTIDIETKRHIGEFAYKDGGYFLFQNFGFGGSNSAEELAFSGGHGLFDNRRYELDVAGNGSTPGDNRFDYGFSHMIDYAKVHTDAGNTDSGMLLAAGVTTGIAIDEATGLEIDTERTYGDGDLVIHFTYTDAWQKGGGFDAYNTTGGDDGFGGTATLGTLTYAGARDIITRAVDWRYYYEALGLASSDYEVGSKGLFDSSPKTTVLISDLDIVGYANSWDVHLENHGNGFGADGSGRDGIADTGNADSKIHVEMFYNVTDLDVYYDIAGVQINDLQVHNLRGDLGTLNRNSDDTGYTSSFGMVHSKIDIFAVKDTVFNLAPANATNAIQWDDGIGIDVQFKGDVDIGALSFGDTGTSIGELYYTDIQATSSYVLSAH